MPVGGGATPDESLHHCAWHAVEAAELGIWRWDVDTGVVVLSAHAGRMLDCDPATALDFAGLLTLIHASLRPAVQAALQAAAASCSDFDVSLAPAADPARLL